MTTWIIGGLLVLAAALAARSIWKNLRSGGCAGGCGGCSGSCGCCHEAQHSSEAPHHPNH